ncbi:NUDIX domain-containing protein [Sphaerimonospora mesophila]|uniref:NUDIX domain-containing protein n=1 Tax=Sphaerimonospora mesophila TaxID=37483 RepID=UPI0006E19768
MTKTCDNASVGVLVADENGRWLMFERATFPPGVAPAAGHVFDDHAGYESAARAEVAEELGLTVTSLELLPVGGWRPNRCRRQPGPRGVGHQWQIYRASVAGRLAPSARETRNVRWLTPAELQQLADVTVAYANGHITAREFEDRPGIEPVWVQWLSDYGLIAVTPEDLAAIDQAAANPQGVHL